MVSSQKDCPVNRVDAERCSPGSTCVPPFGISVFSIAPEPVIRRFIWHFRREFENRSARSPHRTMTVLGSFNLRVCARAGIGGPYAPRGGTAFLWAGNPSAVVPSVSSHRRDGSLRKSTCRLLHSDYVR